jgi:hypothetical protein
LGEVDADIFTSRALLKLGRDDPLGSFGQAVAVDLTSASAGGLGAVVLKVEAAGNVVRKPGEEHPLKVLDGKRCFSL